MLTMVHHILCERTEEAELGVRRLSVNTEIRTKEKRGCQVKARDKRNKHLDFQATKEQGGRHHCAPPDED